jgi:hypothetical protein
MAVASILLVAPGAALAHLNQPDAGDPTLVHACLTKSGAVKIIDGATKDCKKTETRAHWPMVGPQGEPGEPGAPGLAGEPGVGVLGGTSGSALLTAALPQYIGAFNAGRSRDLADVRLPIPTDGTISNFYVVLSGAPGTGKSWTFIVHNGTTDTDVTCTIQGSATSCADLTNSATFAAGEFLSIRVIGSGGPTVRIAQWTGLFLPE